MKQATVVTHFFKQESPFLGSLLMIANQNECFKWQVPKTIEKRGVGKD